MAFNTSDPRLKLLFGMDELGATSTRKNSGAWGAAMDLSPGQSTGGDGAPSVTDGNGGRAVNLRSTISTYTTAYRWLESASGVIDDGWDYAPKDVSAILSSGVGITFGARFYWDGTSGGFGGADQHGIWGCRSSVAALRNVYLGFVPSTVGPATEGRLRINYGASNVGILLPSPGGWTVTGSPPSQYLLKDKWYQVAVRLAYASATTIAWKIVLYEEDTATTYTWEATLASSSEGFTSSFKAATLAWMGGTKFIGTDTSSLEGDLDTVWYYEGELSDDDITVIVTDGITIPWIAPSYEVLPNKVRVSVTNERTDFPPTRPLPTGATAVDHPAGSFGTRPRVRYEGFHANRPWAIQLAQMHWDSAGRRKGRTNNRFEWTNFDQGLIRVPGRLATGSMSDVRNMEFSGFGARRRRGFLTLLDPEPTRVDPTVNGFASFRNTSDDLFRCLKVGTTLYKDTGGATTSIDTGWATDEVPVFVPFRDRLFICSASRRQSWNGGSSTSDLGEAAPDAASALATTTGTLVGTFAYAYTFHDPVTDDETAPREMGSITLATQGASLTGLDTSPSDARFTNHRIYRTVAGGASPDYFLISTQALASSVADNGAADGTISIGKVNNTFITLEPPETFSGCVRHAGRMFYWGGTNRDRVYWSEPNAPLRFFADSFTAHRGPVRQVLSRGSSIVVLTDHSVEMVESDWSRDANGATFERITDISTTVGGVGPNCGIEVDDEVYWIDRQGVYRIQGDTAVKMTPLIDNVLRRFNWGLGERFQASFNPLRNQIIFTVASDEFQENSALMQTQLVWQMGTSKWTVYDWDMSAGGKYDDDLNGVKYGIIDNVGVWKEAESFESDGVEALDASAHESLVTSVAGNVVTDSTQAWTTDEFRGFGLVLRDVSSGNLYYYTIRSNTATTLTLDREVNAAIGASDQLFIGGIRAFFELAEAQMGSTNRKASRQLHTELDDLTRGDNL